MDIQKVFGVVTIIGADGGFLLSFGERAPRMLNPSVFRTVTQRIIVSPKMTGRVS